MIVEPQVKNIVHKASFSGILLVTQNVKFSKKINIYVMYLRRRKSEQYLWLFPSTLDLQMCHPAKQYLIMLISLPQKNEDNNLMISLTTNR